MKNQNQKARLNCDIISAFRESKSKFKLYGKKNEEVSIVADHSGILIVENKSKERYAVKTDEVITDLK